MKTYKKLLLFGLITVLGFVGLNILNSPKALAAVNGQGVENCESSAIFLDIAHIMCDVNGDVAGGQVIFTDSNPSDDTFHYNYTPNTIFCAFDDNRAEVRIEQGVAEDRGNLTVDDTGQSVNANLNVGYTPGPNPTECANYGGDDGDNITIRDPNNNIAVLLHAEGSTVGPLNDVTSGSLSRYSYSFAALTTYGGERYVGLTSGSFQGCSGPFIISRLGPGGQLANPYSFTLSPSGGGIPNTLPWIQQMFAEANIAGCGLAQGPYSPGIVRVLQSFKISGVLDLPDNCDPADPTCIVDDGGGGTAADTCEAKWSNPLTWIMCPVFNIAEEFANYLIERFEEQLCFKVDESPGSQRATPIDCEETVTEDIKQAWSAIKNIVSALLVIIMLVAIIAQAASIGPIDAYTLRKMLPRLVAAVILIQLSFYIFSWIINLVNDAGRGLDSILADVLPGNTNSLNFLLNNAGVSDSAQGAVAWLGVLGLIGFAVAALPALLLAIFLAIIALIIGLAVLIFRKVLLIALLIIAPVALLLWVLPNTERYWKMWWDNFLKLLLMFPIIVLIIEAGRLFAYVAGDAAGGGFIALFLVMVGFFGPLFLLPKTFRWGGTLMQMTGQGLEKAGGSLGKPGKDYFEWRKGISRWSQARATRRGILERRARTEFAKGLTLQGGEGFKGRLRGAQGRLNRGRLVGVSTHEGEVQTKARQSAQTEVAKVFEEELAAATNELTQVELAKFSGTDQDHVREAIALGKTMRVKDSSGNIIDYDGAAYVKSHGDLAQRAALDRAVIHGQWGTVDQYYTEAIKSGNANRVAGAEFFKNANAAAIGEKIPHVLKGYSVAVNSGEGDISRMHGHEIESIIAEYSSKAAAGDAEAANALNGFLQRYQSARANGNLRGNMDIRGIAAVDSYLGAMGGDTAAVDRVHAINYGSEAKRAAAEAATRAQAAAEGWTPDRTNEEVRVAVLKADRESNRSRYQTPGVPPNKTLPLITVAQPAGEGTVRIEH